jgi:hypothetical protein
LLDDVEFFGFIKFSAEVMTLNQVMTIPYKKPKGALVFISAY